VFRDSTLQARISGVTPPPAGFVYQAWLTGPTISPVSLLRVDPSLTEFSLQYSDPAGANLLTFFDSLVISLEPEPDGDAGVSGVIAYQAVVDREISELVVFLEEESPGGLLGQKVVDGMREQVTPYDSHLGFAVSAIGQGDLSGAKSHSEHVINIIEGASGEDYGDWNDNQRAENPGDDFGLEPYLRIYAVLVRGAAASPDISPENRELALRLADEADRLFGIAEEASSLAQRIATGDTAAEVAPLAGPLNSMRLESAVAAMLNQSQVLLLSLSLDIQTLSP
jgi:hypothetical protein